MGVPPFEPALTEQELPDEVRALRENHELAIQPVRAVLQPRLEGHLITYQTAIDALVETHRKIIERSDLDLHAETRWAAVWEMSGRCLALSNALLDQLRCSYAGETVGTARVLHEAANLLTVFADDEEEALTRRWLRGGRVEQWRARAHIGAFEERAREAGEAAGIEIGEGDIEALTRGIYGILSTAAHNDRKGFAESVAPEVRLFTYGPHPDPRVMAVYVEMAGGLLEQVVMDVGWSFARIFGREYWSDTVRPLLDAIHAVRETMPISRAVRAAFGYGEEQDAES